jgi:hypothetical protein
VIVAIINQTSPAGVIDVATFVEAVDEAAGVTQYVGFFDPPLDPADWLGFDTGWIGGVTQPAHLKHWAYDFGSPGLIQVSNTSSIQQKIKTKLLSDPLNGLAVTTVVGGLTITTNIEGLIVDDLTTVVADPTNTKYVRVSYVYNEATDSFSVEAYEKTTGEYALYEPPEYLVRQLGEWFVVANGSVLVPV